MTVTERDNIGRLYAAERRITELERANSATNNALRSIEATLQSGAGQISTDPLEACHALAGKIHDVINLCALGVFLVDDASMEFASAMSVPAYRRDSLIAEFERQLQAGVVGWTVQHGRLTIIPPLSKINANDGRGVLLMPLITPRRVWGMVIGLTEQLPEASSEITLRLLKILAGQGAMAVENANLHRSLAAQNENLEKIIETRTAEINAKNHQLEEAYEELRRVDTAKDDFLSLVAHELRTPLTSILSFSEFLLEDGLSSADIREFAQHIRSEGARLHQLVNDVLDVSRMEAGKLAYNHGEHDLNDIVAYCVGAMSGHARAKSVTIRFDAGENMKEIRCDRGRITQVVTNLLSNAIKYSNENSEIIARTMQEATETRLTVQDFGVGIAARDIGKVFTKFERIESVKNHGRGTGLGMFITKNIVEKGHGGKLWVKSEGRGKGSTFTVTLPRSPNFEGNLKEGA